MLISEDGAVLGQKQISIIVLQKDMKCVYKNKFLCYLFAKYILDETSAAQEVGVPTAWES